MKLKTWLNKGKSTVLFVALALVLVMVCAACNSGKGNKDLGSSSSDVSETADVANTDKELKTIRIATPSSGNVLSENAMLAEQLGYIEEELAKAGYKPEYIGFANAGPGINEAFVAGEIDYAFYNELPAVMAKSNGIDLKIIATVTQQYNYALFVTEKSGITSVEDLKGKRVIAPQGTILYKYLSDLCEKNNVDFSTIEQINSLSDANSILASGEADAYSCAYTSALLLQSQGLGTILANTTENLEEATGITVTARASVLESDRDSAKAIIRALKRASEYAAKNPDKVYALLATETTTEELQKQLYAYDTTFTYFSPVFSEDYRKAVQDQYDFVKENQMLGGEVNLDELLDSTYVDEVMAE